MGWKVMDNPQKIENIMSQLVSRKSEIKVLFPRDKAEFTSRPLKIRGKNQSGARGMAKEMIIERLTPEKGNVLIQSSPDVVIEFVYAETRCRCASRFSGVSNTHPFYGIVVGLPEAVRIEEKRRQERILYDVPDFVSAEFRLGNASGEKSYELAVMDSSRHGLGLVITEKERELLSTLNVGDCIEDISFYSTWSMIKVSGTVKHITPAKDDGPYRGCHILGLESPEIIESSRPKSD